MHELSIAMSIVEMAQEEAERIASEEGPVQVQAVHLRLGKLSGVVKEALLSSYEIACESTLLEGSHLLIEEVPVEVFCPDCEVSRLVTSIQWFYCPRCGTATPTVIHGKELEVVALEIRSLETPPQGAKIQEMTE